MERKLFDNNKLGIYYNWFDWKVGIATSAGLYIEIQLGPLIIDWWRWNA